MAYCFSFLSSGGIEDLGFEPNPIDVSLAQILFRFGLSSLEAHICWMIKHTLVMDDRLLKALNFSAKRQPAFCMSIKFDLEIISHELQNYVKLMVFFFLFLDALRVTNDVNLEL